MIRILLIIDGKSFGGICKLFLDIENNINSEIKFDYLTATNIYKKFNNLNIDRSSLKGRIIYNYRLYKFLKKNKYDIVHINSGAFFFTFFCVVICKLSGIKRIIVHSHNTPKINQLKRIFIKILNPLYRKLTDVHLSCSKEASYSLFTKTDDVIILKNGIDIDKFRYSEKMRKEYRKNLNIENKKVYGHVGRFAKQKNHEFLIDLFHELEDDSIMLLIGIGELENNIREKVKNLHIEDRVMFLGFRSDVEKLLNAIDIFIFPSLYEGFGNVIIESLTNGIPTFVSKNISEEAKISNNIHKINSFNIEEWKKEILNVKIVNRVDAYKDTIKNGFDIKETTKQLEKIYKELIK